MSVSISKNAPSVIAMTLSLSKKNVHTLIAMTLAILISPADAQTSSTICSSTSPGCCWVKRSWQLMGKTTAVSSTSSTACCYYVVSSTGTTTQTTGISGVNCTSTGIVTQLIWSIKGLQGPIPSSLGNLKALTRLGLADNKLNGTIPTVLSSLTNLLWL